MDYCRQTISHPTQSKIGQIHRPLLIKATVSKKSFHDKKPTDTQTVALTIPLPLPLAVVFAFNLANTLIQVGVAVCIHISHLFGHFGLCLSRGCDICTVVWLLQIQLRYTELRGLLVLPAWTSICHVFHILAALSEVGNSAGEFKIFK